MVFGYDPGLLYCKYYLEIDPIFHDGDSHLTFDNLQRCAKIPNAEAWFGQVTSNEICVTFA